MEQGEVMINSPNIRSNSRRKFLRMLAATPALPFLRLSPMLQQALAGEQKDGSSGISVMHDQDPDGLAPSLIKSLQQSDEHISSAKDAINVFDLETVARRKLNVGHLADLTGVE